MCSVLKRSLAVAQTVLRLREVQTGFELKSSVPPPECRVTDTSLGLQIWARMVRWEDYL